MNIRNIFRSKKPIIGIIAVMMLVGTNSVYAQTASGSINGHAYVDLGLPSGVLWATCNLGADSPEEYGDYYAWGETSSKAEYTKKNSKTYKKESYKYDIGGKSDTDAAYANWGGTWRLPSKAETEELVDKCVWTLIVEGGNFGYKVTGPNGRSIFLPVAGMQIDSSVELADVACRYWTSTPNESNAESAYTLFFAGEYLEVSDFDCRFVGCPIRAISEGDTMLQTANKTPENTYFETEPHIWNDGTINGHDYVDLGLSVKWATCNVGAKSPSDYGDYYAWGETATKETYTEENSKTYDNSSYNYDIRGNSSTDAARANWGGTWRLPTKAECDELINKCTWTWTTLGGHNGYRVTGPNGNSIFLPAAGCRYGTSLYSAGEWGIYWSSTPYEDDARRSYDLDFDSGSHDTDWYGRNDGRTVRPVTE